ncbi:peptidyl-prolyl cis-trans isomerase [Eikenella sp. S3360]|uniref:Peptidyl-prolyl cis-trans isomerase n=1 Tax=Eikenella glucosivorans TaxID=2766967 RepID=A0ABS0NB01_9NEIS|nr:peptidylprolyl isomerase [Eikenella glucosivorans]MBH5329475.1 peptidyl-prolyl cis-trans isomerase [Eikenella glucosivorans]
MKPFRTLLLTAALGCAALAAQAETRVLLETSQGNIELALNEERAPKTVENFLAYARSGFYNGTIFHRVIPGFMIQGGGLTAQMAEKSPTRPALVNEAANGLKNNRYTVAMARTAQPHSATSQFFINVKDNEFLNHTAPTARGYGYAVFGKVVAGQNVVDQIAATPTTSSGMYQDVPRTPIVIRQVRILSQ